MGTQGGRQGRPSTHPATLFGNGLGHGILALAGKFRSPVFSHQPAHTLLDVMFPVCMSALGKAPGEGQDEGGAFLTGITMVGSGKSLEGCAYMLLFANWEMEALRV